MTKEMNYGQCTSELAVLLRFPCYDAVQPVICKRLYLRTRADLCFPMRVKRCDYHNNCFCVQNELAVGCFVSYLRVKFTPKCRSKNLSDIQSQIITIIIIITFKLSMCQIISTSTKPMGNKRSG
jgi:hypothetical protein